MSVQKQEYVLWNAVSVPLLQFARYCSIVQTLSLKYPDSDLDLEVTMTSSVTWSHYSLCSISYTCFIGTDRNL